MKIQIKIDGMTCKNCVDHVAEALNSVKGITNVKVGLSKAIVKIDEVVTDETLTKAITDAGYTVTKIKR
jgi:copper chaperone CopZ